VEPEKTIVRLFASGTLEPLAHKAPGIKTARGCAPDSGAEGERFELSIRLTTDNGFRDLRRTLLNRLG